MRPIGVRLFSAAVAYLPLMDAVRRCEAHGFFAGESCSACDVDARVVVGGDRRERLSRFLSGALRHLTEEVGLELEPGGWASLANLAETAAHRYEWADRRAVLGVVETDPKGRFQRADGQVRAAYGHSVDVDLEAGPDPGGSGDSEDDIPDVLYHGTAPRNRGAIECEGLRPMGRQEVHLSPTLEDARVVGRRHTRGQDDPVVFVVDVRGLEDGGIDVHRRGPETFTADRVPSAFLRLLESCRTDRRGGEYQP